jgi:ABC-type lipoprotein export system ATPase subunit
MKKTIIMVTHDPEAAEQASRVLHLNKGSFVAKPEGVPA